jgi:hypothetical protein
MFRYLFILLNLAGQPKHAAQQKRLRNQLERWMKHVVTGVRLIYPKPKMPLE